MKTLCAFAQNYAPLAGRILIAFIFLQSGYFVKNLALMGALLCIVGLGSGPLSVGRAAGKQTA